MKENRIIKNCLFILIFIITLYIGTTKVNAASLSISASKTSVNVGESVTITVTGDDIAGRINITANNGATLDSATEFIDNSSVKITAKMNNAGKVTITATAADAAINSSLMGDVFNGSDSCTINVSEISNSDSGNNGSSSSTGSTSTEKPAEKPTETISNDATLKNLGIKPNDFSGFKKSKTSYDVTVPNSVSSVSVYAVPNSNAKVTGTGKKELQEGANKVEVIVTAQDGKTTKTYTINITRQTVEESETEVEENTVDENTVIEEPVVEVVGLTDLKVEGYTLSPAFDNKVYEYKLDINKNISELKINPITSGENIKVDVVGNTELQEGENVITLLVNNSDKDETTTYQIIVNKTSQVDLTDWNSSIENANKEMQKRDMIIVITIGFIVVASIVFIVYKRRYNKKENATNSKIDKVDEEERIDLNEDKELFNRVNKKEETEVQDDDLEKKLKEIDNSNIETNYTESNELDDFENMDNLEEFLRKRKEDK